VEDLRPVGFVATSPSCPRIVLVSMGKTKVLCTASVEERVPPWMRGSGKGWVTAEYSLLPALGRASGGRRPRAAVGRTQEIQRLIGRSLRAVTDSWHGELQVTVDCDVLQADGGTRTASSAVPMWPARLLHPAHAERTAVAPTPRRRLRGGVGGIVDAACLLDLDYSEDSRAEVDMNVVMTGSGRFIEVQARPRACPSRVASSTSCWLWRTRIATLLDDQQAVLAEAPAPR